MMEPIGKILDLIQRVIMGMWVVTHNLWIRGCFQRLRQMVCKISC